MKSPFPSGQVPHCGAFVHPEIPFHAGVEGTPLSGSAPFPAQALRSSEGWIFRPRSAAARNKSSPVEIPFPIGGWFRIAEHSSTRKSPFMPRWRGCPCLGAPRFRLKRSDHRKAGSSGPRSAAARSKPTQWRSPRCWTSRRTCRSPCSSQSKYIRHLQPS